ncbi:DUF3710 domain-containing protein [Corynebacterium sp. YIM 101645]|uniref:DUF3710 domain-containing protein n=1 Tax=Corynebacterium lemuris TaxID=1859292 RepID=A0ABT2FV37_9CORY|nr:DUF3710 domain-containing protein [Corynebacterium lemuris]MCS5479106.1 DUF3710 domain-containing protein [Corynebacterium lemuris]
MALWPFGKKKDDQPTEAPDSEPVSTYNDAPPEVPATVEVPRHDAVDGDTGPFDGDSVDIAGFDFSDFAQGVLDLGSMRIALPRNSQVQVEMGETGPRMIHIVTEFGRLTPVAFAAPTSAGQWAESTEQITQGMIGDGLETDIEQGPWGPEIIGQGENGIIRVIGVEGPRWMLRMTTTAPHDKAGDMRDIAREITARTFVYRGDNPVLAGNSLPVILPKELVAQVQQAMEQRAQNISRAEAASPEEEQAIDDTSQALRDLADGSGPETTEK